MFPAVFSQADIARPTFDPNRTRTFVGDGTPLLKTPGLKKVDGVMVGNLSIPISIKEKYPTSPMLNEVSVVDEPLFAIRVMDGETYLLRSLRSNHGMWQKDVEIRIMGDWDEDAATAPTPKE